MRLLHTSDWHVGRTIRGRSRMDEFAAVFDEIVEIAADARVDGVLIAGDLFDHPVPTADAERLLYETLLRLRATGAAVVAINGNHESEHRLDAIRPLLAGNDVSLVTGMPSSSAAAIVEIAARDGAEAAAIACVPFIPPRKVADGRDLFDDLASWPAAYAEQTAALLRGFVAAIDPAAIPVLMAHLFASGATLGGGEREVTVGPDYAVSASALPAEVAYVALGHIHRRQRVAAAPAPTWYSGSPLALDFGEEHDRKSVTLVEVAAGVPATVGEIGVRAGKALRTISGSLDAVLEQGARFAHDHLRVQIDLDAPQPGLADSIRDALPGVVDVTVRYPDPPEVPRPALESMSPTQRFEAYLRSQGFTEVAGLLETFDELLEDARTGGS